MTALFIAAGKGHTDAAAALICAGADISAKNKKGYVHLCGYSVRLVDPSGSAPSSSYLTERRQMATGALTFTKSRCAYAAVAQVCVHGQANCGGLRQR